MTEPQGPSQNKLWERIVQWWRRLFSQPVPATADNLPSFPTQSSQLAPNQPRYEVQNVNGQQVSETGSLKQAHQDWKDQTGSEGHIIDRQTGQDITPEPDDNGRYVVLDKDGEKVGSFDDRVAAEQAWKEATGSQGRIIDMDTKTDITPRQNKLSDEQLATALQLVQGFGAGKGAQDPFGMAIDPDLVANYMVHINTMDIPAFDIVNLRGKGRNKPTKTVPIKRREVTIETVRKQVPVERQGPRKPSKWIFVNHPTDFPEPTLIRSPRDLSKVARRQFALPPTVFVKRLVTRRLTMRSFQEEIPGEQPVVTQYEWQEFEEPKVREWTESIEVADEQQAQLLEIVVDVSGSMQGPNINLAIALAIVVMSAHLDDDSRYLYRQFAVKVGRLTDAKTPDERRALCADLLTQFAELGGGTDIILAVTAAAKDVRARARTGQATEVLLITDGDDPNVTSDSLYVAIGTDVTLHTVIVGGMTNAVMRDKSTTYYELYGNHFGQVWGDKECVAVQLPADERPYDAYY